jgi:hypothetical protein
MPSAGEPSENCSMAFVGLPAGQTVVTQSLLAERILKAARDGERDPDRLRTHAITDGNEGAT